MKFFFMLFLLISNNSYGQNTAVMERIEVQANRNLLNQQSLLKQTNNYVLTDDVLGQNRTIADWLISVPGLSLNGQGGLMQSYSLRGLSRSRIKTEVDGIPIITDRRAGNSLYFIAPQLIGSMVIQKGPSSTLYGSGAIGGVISANTITTSGNTLLMSQQNNGGLGTLMLNHGDKHWQSAAVYRKASNSKAANKQRLHDQFEQKSALVKYKKTFENSQIIGSYIVSKTTNIGKSSAQYPNKKISLYPSAINSLAQIQITQNNDWLIKLYHHYQNWDSLVERINKNITDTHYQANTLGALYYQTHQWLNGTGRFGIDWLSRQGVNISSSTYQLPLMTKTLPNQQQLINGKQNNIAIFIDDHWTFSALRIMAGMRFDHIKQQNKAVQNTIKTNRNTHKVNGSLALDWQVSPQWLVHSEYGSSFRFPSLSELYFNGETPRGSIKGNSQLIPETSQGIAFDINYQHNDIQFTFSSYAQQLNNYIERYTINKNQRSYRNLKQAKIQGIEFSLFWHINNFWSHSLNYQWQQGKDENNKVLADLNSPEIALTSVWQQNKLTLQNTFSYRFNDNNFAKNEQALNSVLLWHIKLQYQLLPQLNITLRASNLLNKLYFGSADKKVSYQPGRTLGAALNWNF